MRENRTPYWGSRVFAAFLTVALLALLAPCALAVVGNGKLQIHHVDVAQGDAAVIISPLGQVAMVDDGTNETDSTCAMFVNYVQSLGITSFDYNFASHYHADHIGCLCGLMTSGIPLNIAGYDRGYTYSTQVFFQYAGCLGSKRQAMTKNQTIVLDAGSAFPVYIKCIDLNGAGVYPIDGPEENPKSMVLRISYGCFDEVMGGDLSGNGDEDVETTVGPEVGDVEVYKVHHHGSAYSTNGNWLNATTPEVGVISLGNNNPYHYPTSATLSRLHNYNVKTYWTEHGTGPEPIPGIDKVGGNIVIEANPQPGAAFTVKGNGFTDTYYNSVCADTILPQVTVIRPNGGEVFYANSRDTIRWVATDNFGVDSVHIYYSTDGGSTYPYSIADKEPNDGIYIWTVPSTPSATCKVKVVAYDAILNEGSDTSDNNFTITVDLLPPQVTILRPNGGEIFYWFTDDTIKWIATDEAGVDSVHIYYSTNGGSTYPYSIAANEPNDGIYVWTIPYKNTSTCKVKVVAVDRGQNQGSDTSDNNFTMALDLIPPQVAVVRPNGGEFFYIGTEDTIRWVATDNVRVDSVNIYYSIDGGATFPYTVATSEPNDSAYVWTVPDTPSDNCIVKIEAYDFMANVAEDVSNASFGIRSQIGVEPVQQVAGFGLLGNYPNPFNPMTRIEFVLDEGARVYLRIYDVSGKVVKTLLQEAMPAGRHNAVWNGEDESGRTVVSGVYVCRLEASGKMTDRKIVLLK